MNRHPHVAVALAGVAAVLAACSGNGTSPSATSSSAAASSGPPGSICDVALGKDNVYTIDSLQCADGWAVTSGVLASTQNPNTGAPTSFVFRREGELWVGQDKTKVCGTNPTTTTAPADAAIPAALFLSGCAAG